MRKSVRLAQALELYRQSYLGTKRFAARLRREYLTDLRQLCEYLEAQDVRTVQTVTRSHLQGFLAHLDQLSLETATRRRKASVLRSFFRFLDDTGARAGDPAEELVPPDVEDRRVRYLTEDEYQRLRYAARYDLRDAAMIEVLLQTGMRLPDLAGLRLGDLALAAQSACTARVGSGRHRRIVRLNAKACEALKGYLRVRPSAAGDDLVFQTKFRRGIGARAIEDVVNKYLRAAGIEDASVHDLRHTYAVHSLKRGVELSVVRDMLGYLSDRPMAIYGELAQVEMDQQLQENAL
jgi:site-specific recombinase XerD